MWGGRGEAGRWTGDLRLSLASQWSLSPVSCSFHSGCPVSRQTGWGLKGEINHLSFTSHNIVVCTKWKAIHFVWNVLSAMSNPVQHVGLPLSERCSLLFMLALLPASHPIKWERGWYTYFFSPEHDIINISGWKDIVQPTTCSGVLGKTVQERGEWVDFPWVMLTISTRRW